MAIDPLPTLVIGLGGSGAWTLIHVKKQLMDAYGSMPQKVALVAMDTAKTVISKLGSVELESHEYAHLGGDAYDLSQKVARTDEYPHLKSWYLADWYLKNLPRAMFALDQGAGQFRQLGRLALFRDVHNPANSAVQRVLDNKLTRVAGMRSANAPSMSVIIVGSLVGGTGAGLFIDIPHLVRRVAWRNNFPVIVRGFLYLPQSFKATLNSEELIDAKIRAFAGMRELSRFIMQEDYLNGYPMYYQPEGVGVDNSLWRASAKDIYDYVYFLDGEGNAQINAYDFSMGSASVVADAIMTYLDGNYGPHQEQYNSNIQAKVKSIQDKIGKKAFVGAVGTYSIILPMQQIVQKWSYDLGLDMLQALVPGSRFTEKDYIVALDEQANPARTQASALDEVERLMTTNTEVIDLQDQQNRRLAPTPLWRQVYRFFKEREESESRLVRQLALYDLQEWKEIILPNPTTADPATRRVLAETNNILEDTLAERTQPSDKRKPKGDATSDWDDIRKVADRFINLQLGPIERGGGHKGGQYGDALDKFVEFQLERFREYASVYIMNNLNGEDSRDTEQGKVGKLGWLLGVLRVWRDVFASVRQLLESLRQGTIAEAANTQRAERSEGMETAFKQMKAKAGEKSFFGRSPAVLAQEAFMKSVQDYVDFHRMEFARNAVSTTTLKIREFLDAAIAELETWADILAVNNNSLYAEMLNGSRRVRVERYESEQVANHQVMNDENWEERKYREYVDSSRARERLFRAWNWETSILPDTKGIPALAVKASLNGTELRKDKRGRWYEDNRNALMAFCREIFAPALARESVVGYLMVSDRYADQGRLLGSDLAEQAGYLLSLSLDNRFYIPTNVLLAYHDPNDDKQRQYLQDTLYGLASRQGIEADDQNSPLHRVMSSSDPFRLTLLSNAERVTMEGVTEFGRSQEKYAGLSWDARQRTHIFPAEVRAVEYEEKLTTRLKQTRRLLTDKVRLLLENRLRFKEFLLLMAHKIAVVRTDESDTVETRNFWAIEAPPLTDRERQVKKYDLWWLTPAVNDDPSLLEAMETYILRGKDWRSMQPGSGYDIPIPYEHILKYLEKARREDTAIRIEDDNLALGNKRLRRWLLRAFMPPVDDDGKEVLDNWTDQDEDESQEISALVVRHDILRELANDLRAELPRLLTQFDDTRKRANTGQTHDAALRSQEEYDLYSVAVIELENEVEQLANQVRRRYEQKTGEKVDEM